MSYSNGPQIVTNGLTVCLDAGNTKSYAGSGFTWVDLSGNGINGTLGGTSNPTYSTLGNGSFFFDGPTTYQTITCTDTMSHKPGQSFTYEAWVYFTASSGYDKIFVGKEGCNVGLWEASDQVYMVVTGPNAPCTAGNTSGTAAVSYELNKWYHWVGTYQVGVGVKLYRNGDLASSAAYTGSIGNYGDTLRLGGDNGLAVYTNKCYLSTVRVYNRALAASEVQQNYNATKTRFGL